MSTRNAALPDVGSFVAFVARDDDNSIVLTGTVTLVTGRVYLFSRGVWIEAPGQHTDSEIEALIDGRVHPEALLTNTAPWDETKAGIWTGTATEYAALTPAQRSAYHLLAVSG